MNSKYFKRSEFACKCGCGFDTVDVELFAVLKDLRQHFDRPVIITSACRCVIHNKNVGGGINSQHLRGRAADVVVKGTSPDVVHAYLAGKYPNKYGIGQYKDFTHIDTRTTGPARW